MLKTFVGTYIPDFNSIPSAVLEKKFLENRPIRIFKVTWWPCFLTNLHKSNYSCVGPHWKFAILLLFFVLSALTTSSKMDWVFYIIQNQTWQRCFLWGPTQELLLLCRFVKKHSHHVTLTFSNISAISWRPVLVVEEARVPGQPPTIGKQVVNFIIIGYMG
jgi:hypothetical protein